MESKNGSIVDGSQTGTRVEVWFQTGHVEADKVNDLGAVTVRVAGIVTLVEAARRKRRKMGGRQRGDQTKFETFI